MKFRIIAVVAAMAVLSAGAASDRFFKEKPGSMNGFLAATDPVYVKECGSCHFPYSPGLLPARSWELHLSRLEKHFGENVQLPPPALAAVRKYLLDNAADRSRYEGSVTIMERIDPDKTPYRFGDVPLFREMHRIVQEVIRKKPQIKVRRVTNCIDCHQMADQGSFGIDELVVPGLTKTTR